MPYDTEPISRAEFRYSIRAEDDCWIFDEIDEEHGYWKETAPDLNVYYHAKGKDGTVFSFWNMKKYEEIWFRKEKPDGTLGLWSIWTCY